MKYIKKILLGTLGILLIGNIFTTTFAQENNSQATKQYINDNIYTYYYGQVCGYCIKVEKYLKDNGIDQRIHIVPKEVTINRDNAQEFLEQTEALNIPMNKVGTPLIIVEESNGYKYALIGEVEAMDHFKTIEQQIQQFLEKENSNQTPGTTNLPVNSGETEDEETINLPISQGEVDDKNNEISLSKRLSFFGIMMPAALADSINPCAFAVMLLLLTSILSRTKDRKKALLAGILFSLAIFITYFLLGMGVLKLLGNVKSLFRLKRIVGIVGLFVGLANIKDYFRYGKGFLMEIPMSRRPLMQKIIKKVVSPAGAFVVGVLVSLFLLPCSSGPYLTILGYLSAESQTLNLRGYIYLTVYNLIFVFPMLFIAGLIGFGRSTAEKIGNFKNKNTKLIHLIVGLLMLGLGIYVIGTLYRR